MDFKLLLLLAIINSIHSQNTCDTYVHPEYGKGKCVHEQRCPHNLYISGTCENYASNSVKCCYSTPIADGCERYTHPSYGLGQCQSSCDSNTVLSLDGYCDGTLNKCCFKGQEKPISCGFDMQRGKGICVDNEECPRGDFIQSTGECGTSRVCCYSLQSNVDYYEFRGLWISTVANIDWPSSRTLTVAQQQSELLNIIQMAESINLNAFVFQVRPVGDAMYASLIEPWSYYLTGQQGRPLAWDPLKFICDEAHKRGIEVHAWFNPYRARNKGEAYTLAPNHMAVKYSQYAYVYNGYLWMDPASVEVKNHTLSVIKDVLTRYDVDGIHFDDYFYPYPDNTDFPDVATYQAYQQSGGTLTKADWRRDNVNRMIRDTYLLIKQVKPRVHFGISPFGIWRPGNPPGIQGLDSFNAIYADSRLWLQNGWLDYFTPQLYWEIDPPAQSYTALLKWWCEQNKQNKLIYAGTALYKLQNNNWSPLEIERQVKISRDFRNITSYGNIHFTTNYLMRNYKGIKDSLKQLQLKPTLTPFKAF